MFRLVIVLCLVLGACKAPQNRANRFRPLEPRPTQKIVKAQKTQESAPTVGKALVGSVGQSVGQSVGRSVGQSVGQPKGQSKGQSAGQQVTPVTPPVKALVAPVTKPVTPSPKRQPDKPQTWEHQRARWQQLDRDHSAREEKPSAKELAAGDAGQAPPKDWQARLEKVLQDGLKDPGTGKFKFYAPAKVGCRPGADAPFEFYWKVYYKVNARNKFGDYTGFKTVQLFYRNGEWLSQRELTHRQDIWCQQNPNRDRLASPNK